MFAVERAAAAEWAEPCAIFSMAVRRPTMPVRASCSEIRVLLVWFLVLGVVDCNWTVVIGVGWI